MKYAHNFKLSIGLPEPRIAKNIVLALEPEMNSPHERRSKVEMNINKRLLSLEVNALDSTALKAAVNSYKRLIDMCYSLVV